MGATVNEAELRHALYLLTMVDDQMKDEDEDEKKLKESFRKVISVLQSDLFGALMDIHCCYEDTRDLKPWGMRVHFDNGNTTHPGTSNS